VTNLDIRIFALLAVGSSVLFAVAMQMVKRVAGKDPAVDAWALGASVGAIAFALIALRGIIPDFLSIILGNSLFVFSFIKIYLGLRLCLGIPQTVRWGNPVIWVVLLSFTYYTYIVPSASARIVVLSTISMGISLIAAYLLIASRAARRDNNQVALHLMGVGFLISSLLSGTRAYVTFDSPAIESFMQTTELIHKLTFVSVVLLQIVLTLGLVYLMASRMTRVLHQSEKNQQAALAAANKSAQYARSLIEASLDPLVTINPDGKISDVNKATEAVAGYTQGAHRQ
jgi:PAS domain-containing protein